MVEEIIWIDFQNQFFWEMFFLFAVIYWGFYWAVRSGKIKLIPGSENKIVLYAMGLGIILALIVIPEGDILGKIVGGAFIYGLFMFHIGGALIHDLLRRVIFVKREGTPITKITQNKDYIKIFRDSDVHTLENLLSRDIKNLSDETGLNVESVISFRRSARRFLKRRR